MNFDKSFQKSSGPAGSENDSSDVGTKNVSSDDCNAFPFVYNYGNLNEEVISELATVDNVKQMFSKKMGIPADKLGLFFAGASEMSGGGFNAENAYCCVEKIENLRQRIGGWTKGDRVWAQWSDRVFYPATVIEQKPTGLVDVRFIWFNDEFIAPSKDLYWYHGENFGLVTVESKSYIICMDSSTTAEDLGKMINHISDDKMFEFKFLRPYAISSPVLMRRMFNVRNAASGETMVIFREYDSTFARSNYKKYYIPPIVYWNLDYCYICKNKDLSPDDPGFHVTDKCVFIGRCEVCREHSHATEQCSKFSDTSDVVCRWCGYYGHIAQNCTGFPKCWHCDNHGHTHDFCPHFRLSPKYAKLTKREFVRPHFKTPEKWALYYAIQERRKEWYAKMMEKKREAEKKLQEGRE